MLSEVVNLPEKCVGYIDEIIMPILFYNVQTDVNDKLYLGIVLPTDHVAHYSTTTLDEMSYNLIDLASALEPKLNAIVELHTIDIAFLVSAVEPNYKNVVRTQGGHAYTFLQIEI